MAGRVYAADNDDGGRRDLEYATSEKEQLILPMLWTLHGYCTADCTDNTHAAYW